MLIKKRRERDIWRLITIGLEEADRERIENKDL